MASKKETQLALAFVAASFGHRWHSIHVEMSYFDAVREIPAAAIMMAEAVGEIIDVVLVRPEEVEDDLYDDFGTWLAERCGEDDEFPSADEYKKRIIQDSLEYFDEHLTDAQAVKLRAHLEKVL